MRTLFLIAVISFSTSQILLSQNDLQLLAIAQEDTVFEGTNARIELILKGIDIGFDEEHILYNPKYYNDTIASLLKKNRFHATADVKPDQFGINEYGPFKINILGKELTSNTVRIFLIERPLNVIAIVAPEKAKMNEEIEIDLVVYSPSNIKFEWKKNGSWKMGYPSKRIEVSKGIFTIKMNLKTQIFRTGEYIIDENSFTGLPEYVSVNPVKIIVE